MRRQLRINHSMTDELEKLKPRCIDVRRWKSHQDPLSCFRPIFLSSSSAIQNGPGAMDKIRCTMVANSAPMGVVTYSSSGLCENGDNRIV